MRDPVNRLIEKRAFNSNARVEAPLQIRNYGTDATFLYICGFTGDFCGNDDV